MSKKEKIALFHPWIKTKGGAEKVVLKLLKEFGSNIDLYTWTYDEINTFSEFKEYKINILAPKFAKHLSNLHILRGLFLPLSFLKKIPLKKYDKFLISTSGVGEFITFQNYKKGNTYAYIHTPLREANKKIVTWNLENRYKGLNKYFYLLAVQIYKLFEKLAWRRIDHVIFNSELSKSRAKESNLLKNKQDLFIINPPIDIPNKFKIKKGNYFLYVSRINPPKRQKELIEAFNEFSRKHKNLKLILVGNADNKKYYEQVKEMIKEKNIQIKSNLSNEELSKLYNNCLAGIFLGYQEDFGIVPLEIIGRGKPLFAVDEGGFTDIIKDNPLFHKVKEKHNSEEMIKEIKKELEKFTNQKYPQIKSNLKPNNFIKEMRKVLK